MKRKTIVALLAISMIMGFSVPAYAEDIPEGAEHLQEQGQLQEPVQEETPVVVSTLEELQAAVAAAEDGNTIAVSAEITLDGVALETDKDITITMADTYASGALFRMKNGAVLNGLTIKNSKYSATITCEASPEAQIEINNCQFVGDSENTKSFVDFFSGLSSIVASISNCSFDGAIGSAVYSKPRVQLTIMDSTFSHNHSDTQGGAIRSEGTLILEGCTITGNSAASGGGIFCSGELTITDCQFSGNSIESEKFGTDVLSQGTLSITDDPQDGAGYYEESTGEKVELPLADYASTAKLIYLIDEQAAGYFAPDEPDTPYEEPDTPETPSEPPEQPDNGDDDDDDYEPPVYRPVRPTKPVEPKPQLEPAPALKCNEAVIDTSRSVVLLGYGDGLSHEDDPLTRAQLATIIYRLLDDDSIALYDTDGAAQFRDVSSDAWYYRYVQTINRAGIVLGIGEGNYAPNGLVTWAQTITILSRFIEPQDYGLQHIQYDSWAVDAVKTAVALGWITDSAEFSPDAIGAVKSYAQIRLQTLAK